MTNDDVDKLEMPHTAAQYLAGRAANGGKPLTFLSKLLAYPFLKTEKPGFINDDITPEVSPHHEKAKSHVLARRQTYVQDLRAGAALCRSVIAAAEEAAELARTRMAVEAQDLQIALHSKRLVAETIAKAKSLDDLPPELRAQVLGAGAGPGSGSGQGQEQEPQAQARGAVQPASDAVNEVGSRESAVGSNGTAGEQAPASDSVNEVGSQESAVGSNDTAGGQAPQAQGAPRTRHGTRDTGHGTHKTGHGTHNSKPRTQNPDPAPSFAITTLSLNTLINSGVRAAALLAEIGPELLAAEEKYASFEADRELRNEFLKDRAVKVTLDVFNKMDEEFQTLGFCNWHPFRYFDQMTTFAGIMTRVLAAHGLISSETNPDVYRKLFDETYPISDLAASTFMAPCETFSLAWRGRNIKSIEELKQRLKEKLTEEPVQEVEDALKNPP